MQRLFATACLVFIACSSEQAQTNPSSVDAKRMETIIRIGIDNAGDPSHRQLLERGKVVVDIPDLEVPCVGVRVPFPHKENRAFLLFSKEWFDEHTNDEVANALLEDLGKALSESN